MRRGQVGSRLVPERVKAVKDGLADCLWDKPRPFAKMRYMYVAMDLNA